MKDHLKSIAAPKTWGFKRKKTVFTTRPHPGMHESKFGVCLNFIIKQMLHLAKTTKEAKYIINNKTILVDGKRRKDVRFQTGLLDILTIEATGSSYIMLVNKNGRLFLKEINKNDSEQKLCWIKNKTTVKGKTQLNLSDGRNLLTETKEYKVGDSLMITIPGQEITKHLPFKEKALAYIIKGKNTGVVGHIKSITGQTITLESDGKTTETAKKNLIIVGDSKPAIPI